MFLLAFASLSDSRNVAKTSQAKIKPATRDSSLFPDLGTKMASQRLVYYLQKVSRKYGWKANGTRIFLLVLAEDFREQRSV